MELVFDAKTSLSPFVEMMWRTHSERPGSFISQAASQWEMVVTRFQGKTTFTVRGPETKATPADYPAEAEFFGIVFKLGTYMPHLPLRCLRDRNDLTLPEASGRSFWLYGSAWELPDYDNGDVFAERLVRQGLVVRDPVVSAALRGQPHDYNIRTVRRRFLHVTGMTHKTIQQIARAHRAASLLQQGVSILDTVFEAGYFDQPHLTRALKHYIGQTPAQILGDNQQMSLLYNTSAVS